MPQLGRATLLLSLGLVAYALWRLRDRMRPGLLFALYLVLAGAERFFVKGVDTQRLVDYLLGIQASRSCGE